jgi:hypothetical protein
MLFLGSGGCRTAMGICYRLCLAMGHANCWAERLDGGCSRMWARQMGAGLGSGWSGLRVDLYSGLVVCSGWYFSVLSR